MSVYVVERVAPPDGIMGVHKVLTVEDVCLKYGEGSYKIRKMTPGGYCQASVVMEFKLNVGASYGPPRTQESRKK